MADIREGQTHVVQLGYWHGERINWSYTIETATGSADWSDFVAVKMTGRQSGGIVSAEVTVVDDKIVELDETFVLYLYGDSDGGTYSYVVEFVIKDDDKVHCDLDYDGDGQQDYVEVSMTQAVHMLTTLSSRQELQKENIKILEERIAGLREEAKYIGTQAKLTLVSYLGSVASLGVSDTVSTVVLGVSNIVTTVYQQLQGTGPASDAAKQGFLQTLELVEKLGSTAKKWMPVVNLIYGTKEVLGNAEKFTQELQAIQQTITAVKGQVDETKLKLDRLIQAQDDLSQCMTGTNGQSLKVAFAAVELAATGELLTPIELVHAGGRLLVAKGTGVANAFDVRYAPEHDTPDITFMLSTTAGDDRVSVDAGVVYVDDAGGVDTVRIYEKGGFLASVADVLPDELKALDDSFVLMGKDLLLTTRGVEYFDFREGRYALENEKLVRLDWNGVATVNDDILWSSSGADIVDGGEGFDIAIYGGKRSDYGLTLRNGALSIFDQRNKSPDGTDKLVSVETLMFADQSYNLAARDIVARADPALVDSIVELYIAYLNRVPEADGLLYWIRQASAGMSLDEVSRYFYEAGKSFSQVTGYDAETPLADFIAIIYENVLFRKGTTAPTEQEIGWWVDEVSSGREDIPGLIQRMISDSKAFAGHPVYGAMSDYFENKIEVGRLHAITYGIDYNSIDDIVVKANAISEAVTPTNTSIAIRLMGIAADMYVHDA
jgi:hypothetical protein